MFPRGRHHQRSMHMNPLRLLRRYRAGIIRRMEDRKREEEEIKEQRELEKLKHRLVVLKALTGPQSQPTGSALWEIAKDLDLIKLNLKFFGYDVARALAAALPSRTGLTPQTVNLESKAS